MKLMFPVELTILYNIKIPAPAKFALFSRKVVFPINVRLLKRALMPPPNTQLFGSQ